MTPLDAELRNLIAAEGPIGIDRFMALALGDPRHGYYMTRDPLGTGGDFVTAPEISQMFGELCGLWAAHAWSRLGRPDPVAMVELGPGRGTLLADALRVIGRVAPAFAAAIDLHLVETSPVLRQRQAASLVGRDPVWHAGIDTLPAMPRIVIANEFFDALPIHQFVRRDGAWFERQVGVVDDRLCFGLAPDPSRLTALPRAPEGACLEWAEAGLSVIATLAGQMAAAGGAALIIDYGHLTTGFEDTLQAVAEHKSIDPLTRIGTADLTAHVDFGALSGAAVAAGASIDLLTTQADFLEALGIRLLAEQLSTKASQAQVDALSAALYRLTDRGPLGMGSLFKVLALHVARVETATPLA